MISTRDKTVLVVGSGGREHALAWKLSRSPQVKRVLAVPGSAPWAVAGSSVAEPLDHPLSRDSFPALARLARDHQVDLTVVGPDNPLADGIVDVFRAEGLLVFGPTRAAAELESSKSFAKEVMGSAGVPTAAHRTVHSLEDALEFLRQASWNSGSSENSRSSGPLGFSGSSGGGWVVKADGVVVCASLGEAENAARNLFPVSGKLVIEERLKGEELSWFAFCDGESCSLFEPARDFKRVGDGDQGPNTGGMGAFSPVPGFTQSFKDQVRKLVFEPVLRAMKERGTPFQGLLYAGLMIDRDSPSFSLGSLGSSGSSGGSSSSGDSGIRVIEFNTRFGDPEAQVLLSRMTGDFYAWCEACARGDLSGKSNAHPLALPKDVEFRPDCSVVVIAAAPGYPDQPKKGIPIQWESSTLLGQFLGSSPESTPESTEESTEESTAVKPEDDVPPYFFAGVSGFSQPNSLSSWVTSGGRVLGAMGMGRDLRAARAQAYDRMERVQFAGKIFRRDIALSASQNQEVG